MASCSDILGPAEAARVIVGQVRHAGRIARSLDDLGDSDPADDPAEATGPDPVDAAWWQGYGAATAEAEAEARTLDLTISRLEAALSDARAELAAG